MKKIHYGQIVVLWLNLHYHAKQKKSLGSEYWRKINVVGLFGLKE